MISFGGTPHRILHSPSTSLAWSHEISESNGYVSIAAGHEMGFLEVLDRRRYEVTLVKEEPEKYRAASRSKIDG